MENLGVGIPPKFLSKTLGKRDVAVAHGWICREVGVLVFQVLLLGLSAVLACSMPSKLPGQKYAWYSHKAVLATTGITGKKKEGLRVPGISLAA